MKLITIKIKEELYREYKEVKKVKFCDIFRLSLSKYIQAAKQGRGDDFLNDVESWK